MDGNHYKRLYLWTNEMSVALVRTNPRRSTASHITPGPGTSNSEAKVHLRRVISRAGLGDTVVTGILDQRPLSEPAAHEDLSLTHRPAVLHYGGVQTVPIY